MAFVEAGSNKAGRKQKILAVFVLIHPMISLPDRFEMGGLNLNRAPSACGL